MKSKPFMLFLLFALIVNISCTREVKTKDEKQRTEIALVIHGGAGNITPGSLTPEKEKAYTNKLNEALLVGYTILKNGGSSVDAVEKVIKVMENSRLFNAGRGAVYTKKGEIELDASIMDGRTLKVGALTGVARIKNPISLARLIMETAPHVFFAGVGAEEYAVLQGMKLVDSLYFLSDEARAALEKKNLEEKNKSNKRKKLKHYSLINYKENIEKYGTVGCIALDKDGNLAAGTSTGGLKNKMTGRIGDTPIIGAGTYANNNTCAISCTGQGEFFIRNVVAYDVSALVEYKGMSLNDAATYVIEDKMKELGGSGGLIALDKYGNISIIFNTPGMFRGFITDSGKPIVKMYIN
ncbi:MAG: isoaspartyl peptidase/L-asparaginase [bacterium]